MSQAYPHLVVLVLLAPAGCACATTFYVDQHNASPAAPYGSWSAAATRIQDALSLAMNGDLVMVADGTYAAASGSGVLETRLTINSGITVQSANGPATTTIIGRQISSPYWATDNSRCAALGNGAALIGFTLSGGASTSYGGGAMCASTTAVVSNCVVTGCRTYYDGGGVYSGTVINCTLSGNSAQRFGGGAYNGVLCNCIISGNSANRGAGAGGSVLNNCTVVENSVSAGSLYTCGGVFSSTVNNSIIYYNNTYNFEEGPFEETTWSYCCTTPLHIGPGHFVNLPAFVSGSDFHLQTNSPCINAGDNSLVTTTFDFDGNPRIAGRLVDVGAFEFQSPSSVLSYAWAQQYGLPTDGSADFADPDGDGMNNFQECVAGTDPTNSLSVLRMLPPMATNNAAGVTLSWQSVNNRNYFLERSSNLGAPWTFIAIQNNIAGQAGATMFLDTSATNPGPYFYRVGVQ